MRRTYVIRSVFITVFVFFIHWYYKSIRSESSNLHIFSNSNAHGRNVKEIYATLLCPPTPNPALDNGTDYYFEATRILVYHLLHKPSTKDLHNHRLVVLASKVVLPEQIQQLRLDGAIVHIVSTIQPP